MPRTDALHIDWPLMIGLLALSFVSLFVLYSAGGEDMGVVIRQVLRITMAFVVMIVVAQVAPASLMRWSPYLFIVGMILLLAVWGVGVIGKGAQRWLNLGLFQFQPAEIMKLAVPMTLAWLFAKHPLPPNLKVLSLAALLLGFPVALVLKQPDLGTALMIAASGLVVIFLAGMRWQLMGLLTLASAAIAPLVWSHLHAYQQRRITTLFNPWADPLGSGYHTIQSTIAVGSGGIFGKGWLNGSQSQLEFIPERSTDFIFAVFAEEFGFVGVSILLAVYVFIVVRGIYIAYCAKESYTRLLAGGFALTFFFYVFVNIGMVSGVLPIVGVPLPLISYGGTSMVTLMAAFGILMSIHTHRKFLSR
ncbi:MAG: rod shape-determining protein RodA [Gammaproteobacteria bacterium]|nr:rod shape-determining protein RodA [Gammaproteobacteria bacterium]